jgi:hypothetical protein
MFRPQVRVIAPGGDQTDPLTNDYRFYLFRRTGEGVRLLVVGGGGWDVQTEGTVPDEATLRIPAEFAVPLYEALGEALGRNAPTDTTVLREWLDCERRRVDAASGLTWTEDD